MSVASNLQTIEAVIAKACERVGRNREDVHIIAVTKYVSIERAQEAKAAGLRHFGENYDVGLLEKAAQIADVNWHFIGSLQTKKVRKVIDHVSFIHSLDRLSLAEEIEKRATSKIACFVQVNTSGEQSKHGMTIEEAMPFIESLQSLRHIEVVGLMTMAPFTADEGEIRACFRALRQLRDDIQAKGWAHAPCSHLSMGMSNDYEIAVEEGATFIRVGTSLVGESIEEVAKG